MKPLNKYAAPVEDTRFSTERGSWLTANPIQGQPQLLKKRWRRVFSTTLTYKDGSHAAAEALIATLNADAACDSAYSIKTSTDIYDVVAVKVTYGAWSAWA